MVEVGIEPEGPERPGVMVEVTDGVVSVRVAVTVVVVLGPVDGDVAVVRVAVAVAVAAVVAVRAEVVVAVTVEKITAQGEDTRACQARIWKAIITLMTN